MSDEVTVTVRGLPSLRAKMLKIIRASGAAALSKANERSANEFEALVRQAIPLGPEYGGHLVNSLRRGRVGEVGFSVAIGDEAHKYAAKLELGHRARDGSHVAGRAFWFPAKRVTKKRALVRIKRAQNTAIRAAVV